MLQSMGLQRVRYDLATERQHRRSLKAEFGHSTQSWVEHCVISLFLPGVGLDSITCMHPNRAPHGSKAETADPSVANSELLMCGRGFSV